MGLAFEHCVTPPKEAEQMMKSIAIFDGVLLRRPESDAGIRTSELISLSSMCGRTQLASLSASLYPFRHIPRGLSYFWGFLPAFNGRDTASPRRGAKPQPAPELEPAKYRSARSFAAMMPLANSIMAFRQLSLLPNGYRGRRASQRYVQEAICYSQPS